MYLNLSIKLQLYFQNFKKAVIMNHFNQGFSNQQNERALKKFESSAVLKLNRDISKKENEKMQIEKDIIIQKNKHQLFLNEENKQKIRIMELENHFLELKNNHFEQENLKIQIEKDKQYLLQQKREFEIKEQELFIKQYELELKSQFDSKVDKYLELQKSLYEKADKDSNLISTPNDTFEQISYQMRYEKLMLFVNQNSQNDNEIKYNADKYIYEERLKIYRSLEILNVDNSKKLDKLFCENGYKAIVNCYQLQYIDNKFPTGLGDFLRGCFFLLNLCDLYGAVPEVKIIHPISFFLHSYQDDKLDDFESYCSVKKEEEKPIRLFDKNNWITHNINEHNLLMNPITKIDTMYDFCNYLLKQPVFEDKIYIYNILYPYHNIKGEHKLYMKSVMNPSVKMRTIIYETLLNLNLKEKEYICIHLRCGDEYLKNSNNSKFNNNYIKNIKNEITAICNANPDKEKLLICDNVNIKYILLKNNEFKLKTLFHPISHIGEGVEIEYEKTKNTMLDFYLLAESKHIFCFSHYKHGSGFSQWCATIYGIPYICKIIGH